MLSGLLSRPVLLAVLSCGRYLNTERWQPAAWFGAWATLAVLSKGTGIQLALLPVLCLLWTRRWSLLRRFSLWLPAILVVAIAGLWYILASAASDATGEGAFISEVAMNEARPGHNVLRASKMLASSDWMGSEYRPLYTSQASLLSYLDECPASVVIEDGAGLKTEHGRLLGEVLQSHPELWRQIARYPEKVPGRGQIAVYRWTGPERRPTGKISIPMESTLHGSVAN